MEDRLVHTKKVLFRFALRFMPLEKRYAYLWSVTKKSLVVPENILVNSE
jgi:hypothetical protein